MAAYTAATRFKLVLFALLRRQGGLLLNAPWRLIDSPIRFMQTRAASGPPRLRSALLPVVLNALLVSGIGVITQSRMTMLAPGCLNLSLPPVRRLRLPFPWLSSSDFSPSGSTPGPWSRWTC